MHKTDAERWEHDHVFAQDRVRPGESRTLLVVVITATMMIVEIAAGLVYGSMALLADGLHMASHTAALGMAFLAYVIARRLAADQRFSFGTGKGLTDLQWTSNFLTFRDNSPFWVLNNAPATPMISPKSRHLNFSYSSAPITFWETYSCRR